MKRQTGRHVYDRDVTLAGDGQRYRSSLFQYGPGLCLIPSVLATVLIMALVSGGIVVADGVTDHAPLDVRLKSAVKQSLDDYEQVTIEGLSIEVEFGIVTLEGKVATPAEKHLAARRVRNIVGVRGVVNAIDVDERLKLVQ